MGVDDKADIQKRLDSGEVSVSKKGFPRRSCTFSTKADAEKWARQIESEMDRGVFVSRKEAENTTLAEALERYEREVITEKKGAVQESMRIRIWKRTPLAKRSIASIQGKDIAAYRYARLKEVAPNTVRHEATSRFFEKGLNPMQVSAITGHKTLQMLKRYIHLKAEDLAELLK